MKPSPLMRPHEPGMRNAARLVASVTAILSIGAAFVHLSAAADHDNLPAMMAGFSAVAVLQAGLGALLLWRRPSAPVLIAAIALMLGSVGAWVMSRTVGLPLLPGGHMEPIGFKDGITVLFELGAVPGLLALMSRELRGVALPSPRLATQALGFVGAATFALSIPAFLLDGGAHHSHEEAVAMGVHDHGEEGHDVAGVELADARPGAAHDHAGGADTAGAARGHDSDAHAMGAPRAEHDDGSADRVAAALPGGAAPHHLGTRDHSGGGGRDDSHSAPDGHRAPRDDAPERSRGEGGHRHGDDPEEGESGGGGGGGDGHGGGGHDGGGHGAGDDAAGDDAGEPDGEGPEGRFAVSYEPAEPSRDGSPGQGSANRAGDPDPPESGHGHADSAPCRPTSEQQAAADRVQRETAAALRKYDNNLALAVADGYYIAFRGARYVHMFNAEYVYDTPSSPPRPSALEPENGTPVILDPDRIESFMYAMTDDGLIAIGGMYMMPAEYNEEKGDLLLPRPPFKGPEFGGCLTRWHDHPDLGKMVNRSGAPTPEMLHVWTYRGLEPYAEYDERELTWMWTPTSFVPVIEGP